MSNSNVKSYFAHGTAVIDNDVEIGASIKIWPGTKYLTGLTG